MATILKHGKSDADLHAASVKVQQTVAEILEDIRQRGDTAVRELSIKFDKYYESICFFLNPKLFAMNLRM